ncbi:hypothetical protein ABTN36_18135, partial [Acinetobacter baumannii]
VDQFRLQPGDFGCRTDIKGTVMYCHVVNSAICWTRMQSCGRPPSGLRFPPAGPAAAGGDGRIILYPPNMKIGEPSAICKDLAVD